ncbi:benzaldehyde dehydrogenase [Amycolatopsis acidiphila]|uniref:Aldehyde dehydrogenase family protein n=1 Tax=Amycolatopsis acidiphila TaxID=715473 RepID=A0A558A5C7_9PSEU|nr:benzaldehyde dehydrogenase [Amycolatopsis acidiphila]TVT19428.1 aldehyde dehydrogenase family protein [Amycolatopsis acidiphila]UIJ56762.1 benzaldehyde dehydrogenase [Amycolatopsis acidiphila]GHG55269.1 aldehyde dehydrogenase [Amycolatopsis acidiphila]
MSFLDDEKWTGRVWTGRWERAAGGDSPVIEPATGAELGRVGLATPADLTRSATLAAEAQREWAATPFQERAAILRRAGDLWQEHADELRTWLVREAGSIPGKADFELHVAAQECYEAAALPSHPTGELLPSEAPRLSMVRRVPAGVVGVISPFNAPLILSIRSVAPALALGNTVVLKPDPRTAVCGGVALARVFEEAGLPAGVLHVLPGGADVGSALVEDPHVRVISFTGSTAAGRSVGELAGRHLKRAHLELGGNSALVVLEDADLEEAMSAAAWGSFFHQGQICMTTGRHLVHASLYDEYVERLADKADHLPVGDPAAGQVALGPIIDASQRDKIHSLVTRSVEAGAKLMAGGTYENNFYHATVLADAGPGVPAYDNEVFGPVAPVTKFSTVDEAVKLASTSEYGLSLGIITADVHNGLALADRIPTGIAHINDQTVNDEALAPFGGVAASGTGSRFGGPAANIEAFTEARWVTARGDVAGYPF